MAWRIEVRRGLRETFSFNDYVQRLLSCRTDASRPSGKNCDPRGKKSYEKKIMSLFFFLLKFWCKFLFVFFKFKLSTLPLDDHAREKIIRLLGSERYDRATDLVTIVADRCPSRQQNIDYVTFLLTALFNEASVCFLFQFFFQWSFGLYCISNFFSLKRLGLFSLSIFFPIKLWGLFRNWFMGFVWVWELNYLSV